MYLPVTLVKCLPKNAGNRSTAGSMPDYFLLAANTPPIGIVISTDILSLAGLPKQACGFVTP